MKNSPTQGKKRRYRAKSLAAVLTTTAVLAGVILPAAAPTSASALPRRSSLCIFYASAMAVYENAGVNAPSSLVSAWFWNCEYEPEPEGGGEAEIWG
jgi:hypothetical protein